MKKQTFVKAPDVAPVKQLVDAVGIPGAAEMIGCSESTVQKYCSGALPPKMVIYNAARAALMDLKQPLQNSASKLLVICYVDQDEYPIIERVIKGGNGRIAFKQPVA